MCCSFVFDLRSMVFRLVWFDNLVGGVLGFVLLACGLLAWRAWWLLASCVLSVG